MVCHFIRTGGKRCKVSLYKYNKLFWLILEIQILKNQENTEMLNFDESTNFKKSFLKQKSRIKWLEVGIKIMSFFHKSVKQHTNITFSIFDENAGKLKTVKVLKKR